MTALLLRVPCEHGKWDRHSILSSSLFGGNFCPGGREPTVEEATQWLNDRHYNVVRAISLEGRNQ